jgi:uncharacterized protein (TIGR03435 family)
MRSGVLLLPLFASLSAFAQNLPPTFEVASVRLFADGEEIRGYPIRTSPDTLTTNGISLKDCIQVAYQIPVTRITGPEWLKDVRLHIEGKAAGPVDKEQLYLMLRTLLTARLGVKAHIEHREMPVYGMTVEKGGPKFSQSRTDGPGSSVTGQGGNTEMEHISMRDMATDYSRLLGRPVIDETGLPGRYDIHLDMTPYMADLAGAAETFQKTGQVDFVSVASILIPAYQEQLGLKIEARKDTVDILVIDHAEKAPTAN